MHAAYQQHTHSIHAAYMQYTCSMHAMCRQHTMKHMYSMHTTFGRAPGADLQSELHKRGLAFDKKSRKSDLIALLTKGA